MHIHLEEILFNINNILSYHDLANKPANEFILGLFDFLSNGRILVQAERMR